jgi:hypothetical protein
MQVKDILNDLYTKRMNDPSIQKLFEDNIVLHSFHNVLIHQDPETELDLLSFLIDVIKMNQVLQEEVMELLNNRTEPSKIIVPEGSKIIN